MNGIFKQLDSSEGFYQSIPKDLIENIHYRQKLHTVLEKDKKAQKVFLQMCFIEPKIFFNAVAWTLDPRKPMGKRNWPFILRPKQEVAVDVLKQCIDNQQDVGINKSRDEGASEIVAKLYALYVMLVPETYFIVGSRKKELVDERGDKYTLFAKVDHVFECLPVWLKLFYSVKNQTIFRKDMQLVVAQTGSIIQGETTNENFSAGRRATSILLDEFGRVEPGPAESIEGSVHDVSGCTIYNSTHWYGTEHPFNKALRKKTTKLITLPWYQNPTKNQGLYKSPEHGTTEIVDIDYYRGVCPEVFNKVEPNIPFKTSEISDKLPEDIKFIDDGCENIPGDMRSPWHDGEELKRRGNKRDFISNIWMSPVGSSDAVFDIITLSRIEAEFIKPPKYKGEILLEYNSTGRVKSQRFSSGGKRRLLWWGELINGKPNQKHNYIIGCDPSLGVGSSNSVAMIYDANTQEGIGTWVCPNTPPEKFADTVVALARWAGGSTGEAYIIFENNGGHGINFGRRIKWNGHIFVYTEHAEASKVTKKKNRLGWHSSRNTKSDLLGELGIALSEGLKTKRSYKSIIVHDDDTLNELRAYVFTDSGDMCESSKLDLTSGARERHGDRVTAAGLCTLGIKYQPKAKIQTFKKPPARSYAKRREEVERKEAEKKRKMRRFRY